MLTGKLGAPLITASIISSAFEWLFINAEQAPFFTTTLSGHPILISMPSNFNLLINFAAL